MKNPSPKYWTAVEVSDTAHLFDRYEISINPPSTASQPMLPPEKITEAITWPMPVAKKNASTAINARIATASSVYVRRMNVARSAGAASATEFPYVVVKSSISFLS